MYKTMRAGGRDIKKRIYKKKFQKRYNSSARHSVWTVIPRFDLGVRSVIPTTGHVRWPPRPTEDFWNKTGVIPNQGKSVTRSGIGPGNGLSWGGVEDSQPTCTKWPTTWWTGHRTLVKVNHNCGDKEVSEERLASHYPDHGYQVTRQSCRTNAQTEQAQLSDADDHGHKTAGVSLAPEKAVPNATGPDKRRW